MIIFQQYLRGRDVMGRKSYRAVVCRDDKGVRHDPRMARRKFKQASRAEDWGKRLADKMNRFEAERAKPKKGRPKRKSLPI